MSRYARVKLEEDKLDINISPMIDMVFILLIFFIVTTRFVEEVGLDIDKPQPSQQPQDQDKTPLVIHVTKNNEIIVDDRNIGLSGVRSEVSRKLGEDPEASIIIEIDPEASSGIMVRVMDEAKLGNAPKISVNAVQQG